jgi:hypothetical protein
MAADIWGGWCARVSTRTFCSSRCSSSWRLPRTPPLSSNCSCLLSRSYDIIDTTGRSARVGSALRAAAPPALAPPTRRTDGDAR